jgi:hypothetical protein
LFLGHHDGIEASACHVEAKTSELPDGVADAREEVRVLFDEEARPEVATVFFVTEDAQDDIPREGELLGLGAEEGRDEHRHAALHIQRTAPPEIAIGLIPGERRMGPPLPLCRHHIDVPIQQQWGGVALALEPRDEIRPARNPLQQLHGDVVALKQAGEITDALGLVTRGVGRVEAEEELQQFRRPVVDVCGSCHR